MALGAAAILVLSGCGSSTDGGSASPSPTPTHTAQAGEPTLPQVEGYEYKDVAGSDLASLDSSRAEMDAANAQVPGAFLGLAGHSVEGPDGAQFLVVEMQLGPAVMADPDALDAIVAGMTAVFVDEGMTVRSGTVGGVDVTQGSSEDMASCTWSQGDLLFLVVGQDESSVNDFAAKLIEACEEL